MIIEISLKILFVLIIAMLFRNFETHIIFIIFIILHELAHFVIGLLFGGKASKITIMPFGVSLKMEFEKKNTFMRIIFYIAGPITNLFFAYIFYKIPYLVDVKEKIVYTNLALCIFNLIPIVPLDGGNILNEIIKYLRKNQKYNKEVFFLSKTILSIISFLYAAFLVKIRNISILFLLLYLWYLYYKEEKKYELYIKINERVKNISNYS